jgi:predicted ATPase
MSRARLVVWKALFFLLRIRKLDVAHIGSTVSDDADELRPDGRNFAAWYPRLLQERPDLIATLQQDLSGIVEGLRTLRVVPSSRGVRQLVATFGMDAEGKRAASYDLPFDELSEGQRALIVLYTILRAETGGVACFDEPDNFVALPEIQPWLVELSSAIEGLKGQAFVISHHPEVIDYLAAGSAVVFERPNGGPARIQPLSIDRTLGLKASEIIARGWHDEA